MRPRKVKVSLVEHDSWMLVSIWSAIYTAMLLHRKFQRIRNHECVSRRSPILAHSTISVTCTHCRERQEKGVG